MLKYKLAVEPSGQDTPKYIWVLQKPERMTEGPEMGAETDKLRQITHVQMQLAQLYKAFSQPWQLEKGSTLPNQLMTGQSLTSSDRHDNAA